jgi:glycosyltransferase involved in cell wall biosynthesis
VSRICFLLNNDFTADSRVLREAQALGRAGHAVTILCVKSDKAGVPRREVLPTEGPHPVIVERLFKRRLYKFHAFSLRCLKAVGQGLQYGLGQFLTHGQRFDVVHAHDANMLLLGWSLSRLWGARLVYDAHEYWHALFEEERERLTTQQPAHYQQKLKQLDGIQQLETWAMARADHVITVSDSIAQRMLARITDRPTPPLTLVRNIPDRPPHPAPRPRQFHTAFGLAESTRVLLYQGQIAEKRGIGVLVEALCQLDDRAGADHPFRQWALVVMGQVLPGDAAFYQELMDRLQARPTLAQQVFFHPAVPPDVLATYTASADLGLHPILPTSDNHRFCLPNKIFEYLQAGLPIGVSQFPEMTQIVEQFQVGFTFDPTDPASLAQQLDTLMTHPAQLAAWAEPVQAARQVLHWGNEQRQLLAVYHQVLRQPQPASRPPAAASVGEPC